MGIGGEDRSRRAGRINSRNKGPRELRPFGSIWRPPKDEAPGSRSTVRVASTTILRGGGGFGIQMGAPLGRRLAMGR